MLETIDAIEESIRKRVNEVSIVEENPRLILTSRGNGL